MVEERSGGPSVRSSSPTVSSSWIAGMSTRVSSTPHLRRDKSGRFVGGRRLLAEMPPLPRNLGDMPVALEKRVHVAAVDRTVAAEIRDGYLWVTLADQRQRGPPLKRFRTSSDLEPDATTLAEVSRPGSCA